MEGLADTKQLPGVYISTSHPPDTEGLLSACLPRDTRQCGPSMRAHVFLGKSPHGPLHPASRGSEYCLVQNLTHGGLQRGQPAPLSQASLGDCVPDKGAPGPVGAQLLCQGPCPRVPPACPDQFPACHVCFHNSLTRPSWARASSSEWGSSGSAPVSPSLPVPRPCSRCLRRS